MSTNEKDLSATLVAAEAEPEATAATPIAPHGASVEAHGPPAPGRRQGDGELHIEFISDPSRPHLGTCVAFIDRDGHCLLFMAVDVSRKTPLDESRRLQIAGAIEHLWKCLRGITQPDRIVLPGR